MLVAAIIISLLHCLSVQNGAATPSCGLNFDNLVSKSQLDTLARSSMSADFLVSCPHDTLTMVTDMNKLVHDSDANVCSLEIAQRYKNYYLKYVDRSQERSKKVPKGMKKFVLALGMQMSNVCKKNLLDVIMADDKNLLNQNDVSRLGIWTDKASPLSQLLKALNQPGELILPTDLAAILSRNDSLVMEKMYIQSKVTKSIRRLKDTCQKRFQPIYEQLIMPISTLASIGFDYRDEDLKVEFKKDETRIAMEKWSNIVFLCEALKFVEPVDYLLPAPAEAITETTEGDDSTSELTARQKGTTELGQEVEKGQLRLLTKVEADKINEQVESNPSLRQLLDRDDFEQLELIEFKTDFRVQLGDLIVDKSDGKLTKAVNAFKSHKSEMERTKGRLIRRSMLAIRSMLKKRQVVFLATAAAKAAWRRLTTRKVKTNEDINKMLVTTVEEMADKAIENEFKKKTSDIALFVVVLVCGLAALAVTAWAIWGVVAAALAVGSSFAG